MSTTTTRRAAAAIGATAAALATVVAASPAQAYPTPPAWNHSVKVEVKNFQVAQNNWVRADAFATDEPRTLVYGMQGYDAGWTQLWGPCAENSRGLLDVGSTEVYQEHQDGTWRNHGRIEASVKLSLKVSGCDKDQSTMNPTDWEMLRFAIGDGGTTGWQHIEVVGAGGDWVEADVRVSQEAWPAA